MEARSFFLERRGDARKSIAAFLRVGRVRGIALCGGGGGRVCCEGRGCVACAWRVSIAPLRGAARERVACA